MTRTSPVTHETDPAALEAELADLIAVLAHYQTGKRPYFGAPSRCPDCGDFGLVTVVDNAAGRCENECRVCKRAWVITVRALNEHTRRSRAMTAAHQGTGALLAALATTDAMPPPPPVPVAATPAPPPPPRHRLFRGIRHTMVGPA